jgi:hypothetical protein
MTQPFQYGKTSLSTWQSSFGGSGFERGGSRALCSDGKIRALSRLAAQADTWFSIPAGVKVGRKYVTGYVTHDESATGGRVVCFRHHDGQGDILPAWPDKHTAAHEKLMQEATT